MTDVPYQVRDGIRSNGVEFGIKSRRRLDQIVRIDKVTRIQKRTAANNPAIDI